MSQALTHPDSYSSSCLGSDLDLDSGSYCCGDGSSTETDVMAAGAYVHILKGPDVPVQLGVGGVVDVAET